MSPRYVDRRSAIRRDLEEINAIINLARKADDIDVRNYLTRLSVIRLSGFIETSVENMINGYLEEHSSYRVLNFGRSQASRISNLNPAKLEALVGNFDGEWRVLLSGFLAEDERRQTLGNLIDARHKLAHGKSAAVNMLTLERYQELAKEVVNLLSEMFIPYVSSTGNNSSP